MAACLRRCHANGGAAAWSSRRVEMRRLQEPSPGADILEKRRATVKRTRGTHLAKNRSTFGFIIDRLGVRTTDLAKQLPADASLVSKWKSGARNLTEGSVYFDDVVRILMERAEGDDLGLLRGTLAELFPTARLDGRRQVERCLRLALSGRTPAPAHDVSSQAFEGARAVPTLMFEGAQGRREAIFRLLEFAEDVREPGRIAFVDTDALNWVWEDEEFSHQFSRRLLSLLDRGFRATFAVRLSASLGEFQRFFDACSPVIFHKNVEWHYVQYYDAPIVGVSLAMLNRAVSSLGMFTDSSQMTTMVFQDHAVILQQERFMRDFIQRCNPLFHYFKPFDIPRVVPDAPGLLRDRSFIAFLPDPAFISAERGLVEQILESNGLDLESERCRDVLGLNAFFRDISGVHADGGFPARQETVFIFQLDEMVARARRGTVVSRSLSLSCEREVVVRPSQHAAELESLAGQLMRNEHLHIVLAMDGELNLPPMNCWCSQRELFVQMNSRGFRYCSEGTVVSVAVGALQQCIHRVPPERRERESVASILVGLADGLRAAG